MSDLQRQMELCSYHAKKWKNVALSAIGEEQKKAMDRAFFWMELQSAFTFLWAIEQTQGKDTETKRRLIFAKANLTRKLADYADKVWKELQVR